MSQEKMPQNKILAGVVAIAMVLSYVFLSLGYVLPNSTPIAKAVAPIKQVTSPYLSQRWNVFAPSIIKSDSTMEVQVQWLDDQGERVRSEWIPITEIEQRSVPGSIQPSRIVKQSWNSILSYYSKYRDLNTQQREVVRGTFIQHDGVGGFEAVASTDLIDQLHELGESRGEVIRFLRHDYMMVRFAALVGAAHEDKDIVRVRWRYKNQRVNDFQLRFSDEVQYDPVYVTFGWRLNTFTQSPEAVELFAEMLQRQGAK